MGLGNNRSLDMTEWSSEEWENFLEKEWLWDLDKQIGITSTSYSKKIDSILSLDNLFEYLESVENEKNVRINIDDTEKSITILDRENDNIIWEIKPWNYTYNNISNNNHMFQVVNEPYKRKWFWKLLLQVYSKLEEFWYKWFELPKEEYTHTPSMLNLLTSNWYNIVGRYVQWEYEELSEEDIYNLYNDIDLQKFEEDNLGVTYKLEMIK